MKKAQTLHLLFEEHADEKIRLWFENYLKGVIPYYGIKTPLVKRLFQKWFQDEKIAALSLNEQLDLAIYCLKRKQAEMKFAGIFFLQLVFLKKMNGKDLFLVISDLFDQGVFLDWSTTDWLTVRVLAPLVKEHSALLEDLENWSEALVIWKHRASLVSLRSLVKDEFYFDHIEKRLSQSVTCSERFIQTGIGWVISDWSKHAPERAGGFVEDALEFLSLEVIRRHTKYLPDHLVYQTKKKGS